MVYIFLDGTKAFGINNAYINNLVFLIFEDEWFTPNPNSFRFWVGGGSNCESGFLFEKYSVE